MTHTDRSNVGAGRLAIREACPSDFLYNSERQYE